MPNPWFRLYSEFADDPKVQMMPEHMQRRLIMLFCERCKDEKFRETERAFHWRVTETDLAETKALFVQKGFIDEKWGLLKWDKRQFTVPYLQQERHREKRAAAGLSRRRWINPSVRAFVNSRDKTCVYCDSNSNLTIDHVLPEMKGGDNSVDNLVVACRPCNARKREFTIEQAQMSYRQGYTPPSKASQAASKASQAASKVPASGFTEQAMTDTDSEQIQKQKRKELASSSNELPAVFELPILGGKIYGVPETLYRSYQSAYPAISVMDQFNKMHAWLLSNATDQKTLKGMPRFVNRWLAKAQNESRGGNNGTHAIPSKTARADANLQANIQRQRANGGEGSGSGRQAGVDAQPTLGGLDARRMGPAIIDIRRRESDVCVQPGGADAGCVANGKQSDQDPW